MKNTEKQYHLLIKVEKWIIDYLSKNPISSEKLYYDVCLNFEFRIDYYECNVIIDKLVSEGLIDVSLHESSNLVHLKISDQKLREDKLDKILK